MLDIAISVYSPNGATCLVNDVVTAAGGTNSPVYKCKYEDTPDGGGAGELTLGLRYTEFYDLGYWAWRNLVEISSGDNFLTAATAATPSGSLKCYIDAIWGFDPARGEDSQLAYLNDGTNKVVRCPVQSIGFDSAPTIVHNASTTTTTAATSITRGIATPTAGNRLIAIVATNNVSATLSGWTVAGATDVSSALGLAMWYKTAVGNETSVTVTLGSAQTATLSVMELSGGGTPVFAFDAAPDTQVGPALRTPVIATTPIGSLVVGAFAIENGASLVPPYGWNTTIPNNPNPSTATNYALALAACSASDTNAYQGYASWTTYGATNLGGCCAIIAIPPSGTVNPWITIGQPAGGGGIPAYAAAVTTVGRRRYCGMVTKRTRPNQKIPGGTVTLSGLQNALQGAIGTFNIALAAAVDVGLTCYDAFDYIPPGAVSAANFATSHFPFLTFPNALPSSLYPPTGNVYSGNNSQISVDQFIAYVIAATTADGDQWNFRIGHDRTPRLAKYFDGTTDAYLYNVTLDQSSWSFSALAVQTVDEQDNGTYNAVEVVGATGATGVQASAIVLNTTQIANLGYQIDGTPQYNTALTTTAQCAAQAESLLESNSTAAAANTFTVFTHDDLVTSSCAPGGMQRGDVIRAGANVTLTGFQGDAPNQSGLVLSAVTTLDFQKMESQQDVSFQAIVPDYRTAAAEQANALATSLIANQNKLVAVDQYCVSSNARNYTTSTSSLIVSFPAILAIFAPTTGTQAPISIATANVTCVANASNWIWLNPSGTYSVYQTNALVTGSILMLVAQMGPSGWIGDSGLVASIGVIQVGLGNVNVAANLPAPTLSGHTVANGSALNTLATIVNDTVTYTNAPTDGSATQLVYYYAATGTGNWIAGMELNLYVAPGATYPSASHTLEAQLDLNNGASYDFAVGYAGLAGYGPLTQYATAFAVTPASVPIAYLPGGSATAPTFTNITVTNGTSYDGIHADVVVSFRITNQDPSGSLSFIQLWTRVSARGGSNVPGASTFYWGGAGGQGAVGVGSQPGSCPTTGNYYFALPNVINGSVIDIGACFEDAQGALSTVGVIASSFTAVALDIPSSATAFQNLLTDQFIGLTIDPITGYYLMPAGPGVAIYPGTLPLALGAYTGTWSADAAPIGSIASFTMRFALTNTSASQFLSAALFSNMTTESSGFTQGYYLEYVPGATNATLTLYKVVIGTGLVTMCSRGAAIAASGIYPAIPAIPASDISFHEIRIVAIPGSGLLVPAPGVTLEVYLDGLLVMSFAESTTTATTTAGPSYFNFGGNVGGVAPYTIGTCGPGSNSAYLIYLDPQDLSYTGAQGARRSEGSNPRKSEAKQTFTGSTTPLQTGVVQRESTGGATGHGLNLLFNPSAARGLANWTPYDASGGSATIQAVTTQGGAFQLILPAHAYGTTEVQANVSQALNTHAYNTLVASGTYTLSGWVEIDTLPAGGYAQVAITGLPTGSVATGISQWTAAGTYYFAIVFVLGSGAFSSPLVELQIFSGTSATTTVAMQAEFFKLVLESGSVATHFEDSASDALVTQTHTPIAGTTDGSHLLPGQISARHLYGGLSTDQGAMVDASSRILLARHDPTIQNRDGQHASVAGSPPYIDSSNVVHFPSQMIVFRGGSTATTGAAAFSAVAAASTITIPGSTDGTVFLVWNAGANGTLLFVAYTATGAAGTGYNATVQSPLYEPVLHVNTTNSPPTISTLANNSSHLYALSTTHTAQPNADGSYLASSIVTRRHLTLSGAGNLIRNPRFLQSLAGWSFFSSAPGGEVGTYGMSGYFGGSVEIVSGAGRGATAYNDEIYQSFNTDAFAFVSGGLYTASVGVFVSSIYAGAYAQLSWSDSSGGSGTIATTPAGTAGTYLLSGSFTPTAGATTIDVFLQVISAGSSATAILFFAPKVEYGGTASAFTDDNATMLLASTHEVELGNTGSFRSGSIQNRHLSNATQDGLANGTYTRSVWNLPHQGANLIENPYFAVAAQSPTTEVAANWAGLPTANIAYNGGSGWTMSQETTTGGNALIGSEDVLCRYNTGVTIPASTTYSNRITTERVFAALPGDSFVLNVHYSIASLASLPAGVQLNLHFGFYRYFSDGTNDVGAGAVGLVNLPNVSTNTSGYVTATTTYTVPQPVSKSVVGLTVTLEIEIQNTTGSSYTTSNYVADVRFGYIQCYRLVNLGSEVTGAFAAGDALAIRGGGSTATSLLPVLTAAGAAVATTMHAVQDNVTASAATTTVTLSGDAAFSNANYLLVIRDLTSFAYISASAQTASSFTFPSTSGHVYAFRAEGA